jgi:hypothetical protein
MSCCVQTRASHYYLHGISGSHIQALNHSQLLATTLLVQQERQLGHGRSQAQEVGVVGRLRSLILRSRCMLRQVQ